MNPFYPEGFRVDFGKTPIAQNQRPVFSWGAAHPRPNQAQTACRVQVAQGGAPVWDSTWVETPAQQLAYGGPPLQSAARYTCAVRLRDAGGDESAEGVFPFVTALLEKWPAPWIGAPEDEEGGVRYFRTTFDVLPGLKEATLLLCGVGLSIPSVNGVRCGEELAPAVSDYQKRCFYTITPIEGLLAEGANCLGVRLADGWRRNGGPYLDGMGGREIGFFGAPALTCLIKLDYASRTEWVQTGPGWLCGRGPTVYAHLFDGERYDARREMPGWDTPGFDAAAHGFAPAVLCAGPGGRLMPQVLEPMRVCREYKPLAVTQPAPGHWVFDFGQNLAGVVRVRLPAGLPAGTVLRLRHAEVLDERGELYLAPLRGAKAEDTYTAGETNAAGWRPEFCYHGFRYAELSGYPVVPGPDSLIALAINTDLENDSFFECGEPMANALYQMAKQTERANMHGILTDCPQRDERMGWMNDATVRFEETPCNFEVGRIFPKIVDDLCDTQGPDGSITCTAPYLYGSRPADPVCSSFLLAAEMARLYTGNLDVVRRAYPAFCRWNDCLAAHSEGGIVQYSHYGDWAGPVDCCEGGGIDAVQARDTPGILMSTGYHYLNSTLLAGFAAHLGLNADAEAHTARAEDIRRAFLAKWFSPDTGIVATGSQGCQAFALRIGILPPQSRALAAAQMNRRVEEDGLRLTTANLTTAYLIDMLAQYGYADTAWALITRRQYPSWGYMLAHGATTVWERWELKKEPGMNSHSHPMYGAAVKFFHTNICGIRPGGTGFGRFEISPCFPAALQYAQGAVNTCKGRVHVRWHRCYGTLQVHITIPFGAAATVCLPGICEEKGSGYWAYIIKETENGGRGE